MKRNKNINDVILKGNLLVLAPVEVNPVFALELSDPDILAILEMWHSPKCVDLCSQWLDIFERVLNIKLNSMHQCLRESFYKDDAEFMKHCLEVFVTNGYFVFTNELVFSVYSHKAVYEKYSTYEILELMNLIHDR